MRSELIEKVGLSYAALVLGYFRDLASHAIGLTKKSPESGVEDGEKVLKFTGVFDEAEATAASGTKTASFGHMPVAEGGKDLSQRLFYEARYEFAKKDDEEQLRKVELRLAFLNARLLFIKDDWSPAVRERVSNNVDCFKLLAGAGESQIGIAFEAHSGNKAERFAKLTKGIPNADLVAPAGFKTFDEENLVFRLDLRVTWDIPEEKGLVDRIEELIFDDELGIPNIDTPGTEDGVSTQLFHEASPEEEVDALVHVSRRFAIEFASDDKGAAGLTWVNKLPKEKADDTPEKKQLRKQGMAQRVSFGLGADFEGLLLDRLSLAWLDGSLAPTEKVAASVSRAAVSFGSKDAKFYFTAEVSLGRDIAIPLIDKAAAPLTLRARFEASQMRYVTLEGTFEADLKEPWEWLEQRTFSISVVRSIGDKKNPETSWGLELSVSGGNDQALFKIERPSDGAKRAVFNHLGAAMAFGPWIYDDTTGDPNDTLNLPTAPTDPHRRGLWYPIGGADNLASPILTFVPIAELFRERLHVHEIAIRAAYLRVQQRPKAAKKSAEIIDTALLFDYGIRFDLKVPPAEAQGLNIQASVEGLGFVVPNKPDEGFWPFAIVLMKDGKKEVGISDPSLWKIPILDKILAVTKVQLRSKDQLFLVFDFGVTKGFKFLKVDQFRVAWAIVGEGKSGVEVYPSSVTLFIPGAVRAQGYFDIADDKEGHKSIKGALDLTIIPLKLRLRVGCRIETLVDAVGNKQLAIVVAGDVVFPGAIPIAGGMGLKGIGLLYASHFERAERAETGGFSPALQWLQDADGDVVGSVVPVSDEKLAKKNLWRKAFDQYAFGAGLTLVSQVSENILSINGMLLVELPGPRILVVTKVTIISKVKSTQEQAEEKKLVQGILGLIDLDFERQQYTLAAFADLRFVKLLELKIPVEASFSTRHGNNWHFYLGIVQAPVTGVVDLSFAKLTVKLYLMLAGDKIAGVPDFDGVPRTYDGFALALGVEGELRIGGGRLFIEVAAWLRLLASFGNGFAFLGDIGARGRLHLFIIDLAASAAFKFSYRNTIDGISESKVGGEVCGSIRILFVKLKGCVSVGPREGLPPATKLDDLVGGVHLQSGAPVLLQGQAIFDPIDAQIERAVPAEEGWSFGEDDEIAIPEGSLEQRPKVVPIDVLIVIRYQQTPKLAPAGFLSTLGVAGPVTRFRTGEVDAEYEVTAVRLLENPRGASADILTRNPTPPATWWRKTHGDLQNSSHPVDLALLNRTPFATPSASARSPQLSEQVGDAVEEICNEVAPPRPIVYSFAGQMEAEIPDDGYDLNGVVCDNGKWSSRGAMTKLLVSVPNDFEVIDDRPDFFGTSTIISSEVRRGELEALAPDREDARGLRLWTVSSERDELNARESYTVLRIVTERVGKQGDARTIRLLVLLSSPQLEGDYRFVQAEYDAKRALVGEEILPPSAFELGPSLGRIQQVFAQDCLEWKREVDAVLSLFSDERYHDWTPAIMTIVVKEATETLEIGMADATASSDNELATPPEMLVGLIRFLRAAEESRESGDQQWIEDNAGQVQNYLDNLNAPPFLLRPSTSYRVEVEYEKRATPVGGDTVKEPKTQSFLFRTAHDPPRSLMPYVLTTIPTDDGEHVFTSERPSVILNDLRVFHILRAHGAFLKMTVTRGDGEAVKSADGTVDWSVGVLVDPETVITTASMVSADNPRPRSGGLVVFRPIIAGTPYQETLKDLLDSGKLPCINAPETGFQNVGIELDVALTPLRQYIVRFDIVAPDGTAWPWRQSLSDAPPAFEFDFATSLYASAKGWAAEINGVVPQRRVIESIPEGFADSPANAIRLVETSDAEFDHFLSTLTGDLALPSDRTELTFYYEHSEREMRARFMLLTAIEPLVRTVQVPQWIQPPFEPSTSEGSGLLLLERVQLPLWVPHHDNDEIIERLIIDSSRERLLVEFRTPLPGSLKATSLRLSRNAIGALEIAADGGEMLREILPEDLIR